MNSLIELGEAVGLCFRTANRWRKREYWQASGPIKGASVSAGRRSRKGRWVLEFSVCLLKLQDLDPPSLARRTTIPSRHRAARTGWGASPQPQCLSGLTRAAATAARGRAEPLGIADRRSHRKTHRCSPVHSPWQQIGQFRLCKISFPDHFPSSKESFLIPVGFPSQLPVVRRLLTLSSVSHPEKKEGGRPGPVGEKASAPGWAQSCVLRWWLLEPSLGRRWGPAVKVGAAGGSGERTPPRACRSHRPTPLPACPGHCCVFASPGSLFPSLVAGGTKLRPSFLTASLPQWVSGEEYRM